jgi:ketosteroid isomerase-like protein
MASENVELVRSIFAAWEQGDYFGSGDWAHSEIEFVLPDGPDSGSWTGIAEMVEAWRNRLSAWENVRYKAEELRELDQERVLVLTTLGEGRGKTSGVDLAQIPKTGAGAAFFHIRDGKVIRLVAYFSRDRALADLGLSE